MLQAPRPEEQLEQEQELARDLELELEGTIVVVTKVPKAGQCKTRLVPLLGEAGSARLAEAMLKDVVGALSSFSSSSTFSSTPARQQNTSSGSNLLLRRRRPRARKVLLYAPGTDEARIELKRILRSALDVGGRVAEEGVGVEQHHVTDRRGDGRHGEDDAGVGAGGADEWTMLAMESSVHDRDLSVGLARAARRIVSGNHAPGGTPTATSLVFVGSDAPEIPVEEVERALRLPPGAALICPARDGGYGLLGVSLLPRPERQGADGSRGSESDRRAARNRSPRVDEMFRGVLWSHPLTALSQIKALQLAGWDEVRVGQIMRDVDEPSDAESLCRRLQHQLQQQPQRQQPIAAADDEDDDDDAQSQDSDDTFGCLALPSPTSPTFSAATSLATEPARATSAADPCRHTVQAFRELGMLP